MNQKVNEMYKLYRDLHIFKALYSALSELTEVGDLPLSLVPSCVHMYDQVVVDMVKCASNTISFSGKMTLYRRVEDHSWFVLSGVTFYHSSAGGAMKEISKKKGKAGTPQGGKRLFKVDNLKMWVYNPVTDCSLILVAVEGASSCPYTVQVERRPKKNKKVVKKIQAVKPSGGYNPLTHATVLGRKGDPLKGEGMRDSDWRRPMPYNEKLMRARGEQELVELGVSQVGQVEVLRGRWRKRPKDWPHRCVEQEERHMVDRQEVSRRLLASRTYTCLMRGQDRDLAELAVSAAGTLALTAHNVHVVEQTGTQRTRETRVLKEVKDSNGTKRRNIKQFRTFDSKKNFVAAVSKSPIMPKRKRASGYVIPKLSSAPKLPLSSAPQLPLSSAPQAPLSSALQAPLSSGSNPGFVGCVRLSDSKKGWLEPCSSGGEDSSSSIDSKDSSSSSVEVVMEMVKRGKFWGRFVRQPPRLKLKRPKSNVVPQVPVLGKDLDFLDDLIIDSHGETQAEKDIVSEDFLLEQASSSNCENNNILRTDCGDMSFEKEMDVAVHSQVNYSNEFVLDLFNTEHDILHRDLEELEFQNM